MSLDLRVQSFSPFRSISDNSDIVCHRLSSNSSGNKINTDGITSSYFKNDGVIVVAVMQQYEGRTWRRGCATPRRGRRIFTSSKTTHVINLI